MYQTYKQINLRQPSLDTIDTANDIINEYKAIGLKLRLRQLYYQFVARDLIPNTQKSYKNLGTLLSNGRLAGLIDWNAIEDRTRFLRGNTNWDSPAQLIGHYASTFRIDMWENQEVRIEVWIEKDALVGVIEKVCMDNDVDYFACRGYVSQSELYQAGRRIKRYRNSCQETVIIHLGDHDPSGIDMTRDNHERIELFSEGEIVMRRIALNGDQIEQYNPPPNPTKMTDSRASDYVAKFGYESWELDALDPKTLESIIQGTIDEYKNQSAWEEKTAELVKHKKVLDATIDFVKEKEGWTQHDN